MQNVAVIIFTTTRGNKHKWGGGIKIALNKKRAAGVFHHIYLAECKKIVNLLDHALKAIFCAAQMENKPWVWPIVMEINLRQTIEMKIAHYMALIVSVSFL